MIFSIPALTENCDKYGTLFYEDIGCKPKFEQGKPCPTSYECGPFTGSNDTCMLSGRLYAAGEPADSSIQGHSCQIGCICRQRPL